MNRMNSDTELMNFYGSALCLIQLTAYQLLECAAAYESAGINSEAVNLTRDAGSKFLALAQEYASTAGINLEDFIKEENENEN